MDRLRSVVQGLRKLFQTVIRGMARILHLVFTLMFFLPKMLVQWLYKQSWAGLGTYINLDGKTVPGKTLWDWMQLLIVPALLAGGVFWLNQTSHQNEVDAAKDAARETVLENYIDRMNDLFLKGNLSPQSDSTSEVVVVAQTLTITALERLDIERKVTMIGFLYNGKLIQTDRPIISLTGVDLTNADLNHAGLAKAMLSGVIFVGANLNEGLVHFM